MAEKEPEKSKRDKILERLKSKYPDREYVDDDALFGQIDEDFDASDAELGQYKERERQLSDLFSKDHRSAQFITDMAKGEDPWIAVIKRLGIDGITDLMNDPAKQEAYAEANKEYVERLAKEKSLDEEYQANIAESIKMLEGLQQERGLSDETIDAAMDLLLKMADEAVVGKFSPESVDMALKAVNHDADVEASRQEGEIAGKNAKIDEGKLRKSKAGDGLPAMGGANNGPTQKRSKGSLVDYAESIGIRV